MGGRGWIRGWIRGYQRVSEGGLEGRGCWGGF